MICELYHPGPGAPRGTIFRAPFAELLEPLSDNPFTKNHLDEDRKLQTFHAKVLAVLFFFAILWFYEGKNTLELIISFIVCKHLCAPPDFG